MFKFKAAHIIWALLLSVLASCGSPVTKKDPEAASVKLDLKPAQFEDFTHWRSIVPKDAFVAFSKSCTQIPKRAYKTALAYSPYFGDVSDWKMLCQKQKIYSPERAHLFFEDNFTPVEVVADNSKFTGYYEPILYGSYKRGGAYQYPLYAPPQGLSKPYPPRSQIVRGALKNHAKPLIWVTSEIDSFFLQIQGSGRIVLPDGKMIKAAYADQNGHKYFAIGKYLIEKNYIPREKMSARAIKIWLKNNPQKAQYVMNKNPSYVFFKLKTDRAHEYAKGAAGVPLTPEYSLAVDRKIYPYGLPMWVETNVVVPDTRNYGRQMAFHRLMIAQDTGGAIKGPVRGDVFFGTGSHAEFMASHLASPGKKYLLLPKNAVAQAEF
ncbi:MAG: MltA domain-containing protein [Pseudomonadota bacterium]